MHHLTLHHGPNSRLVASDALTDFTSLTTNQLLGLQKTLHWCISWIMKKSMYSFTKGGRERNKKGKTKVSPRHRVQKVVIVQLTINRTPLNQSHSSNFARLTIIKKTTKNTCFDFHSPKKPYKGRLYAKLIVSILRVFQKWERFREFY